MIIMMTKSTFYPKPYITAPAQQRFTYVCKSNNFFHSFAFFFFFGKEHNCNSLLVLLTLAWCCHFMYKYRMHSYRYSLTQKRMRESVYVYVYVYVCVYYVYATVHLWICKVYNNFWNLKFSKLRYCRSVAAPVAMALIYIFI